MNCLNRGLLGSLVAIALASVALLPAQAQAAETKEPHWEVHLYGAPTRFEPAGKATYFADLINVGNAATHGEITFADTLPAGVSLDAVYFQEETIDIAPTACSTAGQLVTCTYPASHLPLGAGNALELILRVSVTAPEGTTLTDSLAISGGGAAALSASTSNQVSSTPAPYGLERVEFSATNPDGTPYTQAGGHPYALTTSFFFNTIRAYEGNEAGGLRELERSPKETRDIYVDLPSGFIGNAQFGGKAAQCTLAEFWGSGFGGGCPAASQIGTISYNFNVDHAGVKGQAHEYGYDYTYHIVPTYNMVPVAGSAAQIGYIQNGVPLILSASLRSGGDYGVRISSLGLPELDLKWVSVTTWGVPHDPRHNPLRGRLCTHPSEDCSGGGESGGSNLTPYLRLPTSCASAPLPAGVLADPWPEPGVFAQGPTTLLAATGCAGLHFEPKLEARPTTNLPDAPSGLDLHLHLGQENANPQGTATADLKDAVITLPQGMKLDPSAANGLQACSEAQIGYKQGTEAPFEFGTEANSCPDASKLGTVEVNTPVLEDPLPNPGEGIGALYLATPHQNPFGSLLAAYLVIEDPKTGIQVKLAGKIEADKETGQLTTRFEENPQTPFEDLKVHVFGGAKGSFRTPAVCGTYKSNGLFTPWSAPESPSSPPPDEFAIAGSCAGSEANEPNSPSFSAGTESPQAGTFSPFAFRLARNDGSQELSKIETVLPPGLVGKLAGVGECPEAQVAQAKGREHAGGGAEEQASPSCPASSELGTVEVGAGAGPDPYYTQGHAYLAGPYEGAPLSLVIITPAVAGPFDLGNVVVRTALYVNPETAQITAKSDPIPHIIDGIPLDVRSIELKLSRPNFTLNPTSCNELSFGGSITSVLGAVGPLAQRFQAAGCSTLPFKPKLTLSLKGSTKRTGFPALSAVLTMKPGEANVAWAQVTLPHSAFLEQAHIVTICTRVQFAQHACPAGSKLGFARAVTPLLDQPLEGPVYLRSSSHELPDLVADLGGQIEVALDGRVDSVNGRLRNTFEVVPDAPVSKFTLNLAGGRRGLIVNSENLCAKPYRAITEFTAQNGKVWDKEPVVKVKCRGKGHGHGHRHRTG